MKKKKEASWKVQSHGARFVQFLTTQTCEYPASNLFNYLTYWEKQLNLCIRMIY